MPWTKVPNVFFSYSQSSSAEAQTLAKKLRDAGINVFLDQWSLVGGESWQSRLEQALTENRTVIVFFDGSLAGWQKMEIDVALQNRVKDPRYRVIPVVWRGRRRDLPPFLSTLQAVTFPRGIEDPEAFRLLLDYIHGKPSGPPRRGMCSPAVRPPLRASTLFAVLIFVLLSAAGYIRWSSRQEPIPTASPSEITQTSILRGEILDSRTHKPLPDVVVSVPRFHLVQRTDHDGQYIFILPEPEPGPVRLRASKAGYTDLNVDMAPSESLNTSHLDPAKRSSP
jgi:TIR domain